MCVCGYGVCVCVCVCLAGQRWSCLHLTTTWPTTRLSGAPRLTWSSAVDALEESDLDSASICAAELALTGPVSWLLDVTESSLLQSALCVTFYWLLGRLRVDLINWVSNVRPYARPSTKSFFDFNEIRYVGRGRWVMHDGMQYDPIQGLGHKTLKVRNSASFKGYLLPHL